MKRRLLFLFIIFSFFPSFSQSSSNSWIDYSQSYYKFNIAADGLYRINFQTLVDANIPLSTFDPKNFQLFARGEQVPIYIRGEADGVFNATDYIEFYATANDGWLDTVLYQSSVNQPNPYYSLFNDTIAYYLTWNNSTNNLRFTEENAIDFSNYFPAPYVLRELVQRFSSNYYDGESLSNGLLDPEYVPSEGWMDAPLTLGRTVTKVIQTPNLYTSGPLAQLEFRIAGASNFQAVNGDHHLRVTFGNQLVDTIFEGYELIKINRSFSPASLNNGNNSIVFTSINDRNSTVDRTALAYIKLRYPQSLSFGNQSYYKFQLDNSLNQNGQLLEIAAFNGGSQPVLYDLSNRKKVLVIPSIGAYKTIVPNGSGRKTCVIANENQINLISDLKPVGQNARFTNYAATIQDTSFLFITHDFLFPEVTTYAAYKRSEGYSTVIALIDELYDQYAYGIHKNPLAIRLFVDAAFKNWLFPPSHLFLIGKSVNAKDHRKRSLDYQKNLVPTFGNPASDNMLTSGLNGTFLETALPTGRLSAQSSSQVGAYLQKVIEYESAAPAIWMKRALHFAGGNSALETNTHENYLNGFGRDFASEPYGGITQLFRKTTSAPFQISLSDSIRKLVNEGVSLLTFFGHSSATGGFDISIDSPDKLQNRGKYHLLLANSCFAGNTHQANVLSTSEQYVLEPQKGAIAFIASGNLGFSFTLNIYSSAFYKNFAGKNYGKSLAENMRLTAKDIQGTNPSLVLKSVILEMTLQGDPSIVLNAHPLPDYSVSEDFFKLEPKEVTSDLDSFKVNFVVRNIGRATNDSILIRISRRYPSSQSDDTTTLMRIAPISNQRTLSFTYPVEILKGAGINKFTLVVDPFSEIQELSKFNNTVEVEVFIRSGEIIPVYPYDFSIVGSQAPSLRASTAFAFEEEKSYAFELDTNFLFNSLFKKSQTFVSSGGAIKGNPSALANMADSTVYFWRVSKVPTPGETQTWRNSSFQYINGESGWSQDHFDQFRKNNYLFIQQNFANKQFEFTDRFSELYVKTIGTPPSANLNDIIYSIDADSRERGSCFPSPAFLIAVLDSLTLESWQTPFNGQNAQNDFGQANVGAWCFPNRNRSEAIFNFQARDTTQLFAMRDFLNNSIPDGAYVVAYNWFNIDFDAIRAIDSSILQAFTNLGSSQMGSIPSNHPFIITVQKGNPQSLMEEVGATTTSSIEIRRTLRTSADFGTVNSTIIGKGKNFNRIAYRFKSLEQASADSIYLKLLGYNQSGQEQMLFDTYQMNLDTVATQFINSNQINRLKFNYTAYDPALQTAPQLLRWQVNFDELPDLALSPNVVFSINKDSLQRGEPLDLEVAIQNVSKVDLDSFPVAFRILRANNQIDEIVRVEMPPLKADSIAICKVSIPTGNYTGRNTLLIEVNPEQLQEEIHAFNNFGQFEFFVRVDNLTPLLDVTFDGRKIMNRDIVSSTPQIDIALRDNNSFMTLDDTSAFAIYITAPNQPEELLNYGLNPSYELKFMPASTAENKAMAQFNPKLEQDGIYRLRIQAKDKSGNEAGEQDYRVEFEVINKTAVTHLLNYPNPFSTSTRFVFTLTGNQIPDQIQIQIMTITGKVVREIDQFELGPLHIGNNITEFAWDGKDMFGDQLANGVYLYRVKMRINGTDVERRNTNIDQYFTREFGKMYLLR